MPNALPAEPVRVIRRTLNAILRKTSAVNAEVAYLFDLLDGMEASGGGTLDTGEAPAHPPGRNGSGVGGATRVRSGTIPDAPDLGAPGLPKRYEVRDVDGQPKLLEWRDDASAPGGTPAAPFAVPRDVYGTFAATLAAHSGKKFDVVFRKAAHALGEDARDYHGRVLLRFWQSRGLVNRDRGRYAVAGPRDDFPARARAAWDELAARRAADADS